VNSWERRQAFWLCLGLASLFVALGAASVLSAYVRDQAPNVVVHETEGGEILMFCGLFACRPDLFDPRPWYAVGGALVALAAAFALLAARRR
jgi:hypothetical protein